MDQMNKRITKLEKVKVCNSGLVGSAGPNRKYKETNEVSFLAFDKITLDTTT